MNKELFFKACETEKQKKGIGTLGEKTLHSILKNYYEPYTENHEIRIGNYVADIVGEKGIIEIQTRNFNTMRKKLSAFLEVADVTIVYPVAMTKWLCWIDQTTGEVTEKRKSPKKGVPQDIFYELYKIKDYLKSEKLHFKICMLEITEYRYLNGWSYDKKRGSTRCDRIPTDILGETDIYSINDYIKLIPDNLCGNFTSKDFSKASHISVSSSQTALNILNYLGIVKRSDKKGNSYIYTINETTCLNV